jgi:flagellar FliL protein
VSNLEEVEIIKTNMPKVRSRLLLLLSGKRASEINTPDGKQQLSKEIIEQIKMPFDDKGPEQDVTDVLFTSFIIQ